MRAMCVQKSPRGPSVVGLEFFRSNPRARMVAELVTS